MRQVNAQSSTVRPKRFELIEHTADTGLRAYGTNLPEAFANAAYGLFSIITDLRTVRQRETRDVVVQAHDIEELLFDWMNQLIYLFDVDHILLKRFDMIEFGPTALRASCRGEDYDPSRHQLRTEVKSATYHMLQVNGQNNTVRVIFDI
ncbi:MAG: archease [Chloroflexota bacterium]